MLKEIGKILSIAESISRKINREGSLISSNSSKEELSEIISTLKGVEKKLDSVSSRVQGPK